MSNWFYLHFRAIAHALRRLAGQPVGTALSALVVGIALSLPGGGYLVLDNVASLARGVSGTPEISVFLDAGSTRRPMPSGSSKGVKGTCRSRRSEPTGYRAARRGA